MKKLTWRTERYLCVCMGFRKITEPVRTHACMCVHGRESAVSSCLHVLLPLFLSLSCLSPSNKAEYLFPLLQLSGPLKGTRDRADISVYMYGAVCGVPVFVCELFFSHSHTVLSACLITYPKCTVAS